MKITSNVLAEFLFDYAKIYREAYEQATTPPPAGRGYPKLPCSPFLKKSNFDVCITDDGVLINHRGQEPEHQWFIAGGPALKVDYEPTRTPPEIFEILKAEGIFGKPIGIYRIVTRAPIKISVWQGKISGVLKEKFFNNADLEISLTVREIKGSLAELVNAYSFGAYGDILDIHLPKPHSPIGQPHLIKNFGVFPADLNNRRFFTHLEIHGQSDIAAWDKRLISLRVEHDLRRDLASLLVDPTQERGGTMSFGGGGDTLSIYTDRLAKLSASIAALRAALQFRADDVEAVFHEILLAHPLLLDVYGTCESKPQFLYPDGKTSPIGKKSLEPDFLIKYSDRSYKLIEIERASKSISTIQGQPRAEVTQAVFQCAEWRHYIKTHYQSLASKYPDIQTRCKTSVIMSRNNQLSFKGIEDINEYKGLMMEQFRIDEFFTYDDLYDRAKTAYDLLAGLMPNSD